EVPDPVFLFDVYPLHPRVKAVSGALFRKHEYFSAVFEATKAFNYFLRTQTGLSSGETNLARECFGDPHSSNINSPQIQLNALDPVSPDARSHKTSNVAIAISRTGSSSHSDTRRDTSHGTPVGASW